MLKCLTTAAVAVSAFAAVAAPEIVPVSTYPTTDNFIMESPATDCRYRHDFADISIGANGSYGLVRKSGAQRISTFECSVRIDNNRIPVEISTWGNQSANNLNNIATCEVYINQVSGNTNVTTVFPMTPVYLISSAAVVQYKVDILSGVNTSGNYVVSAGLRCDAHEGVSAIYVSGIGVKYSS